MKATTEDSYARSIDRVVAYLNQKRGAEPPTLARLAGIARISPYHFHRVYRAMTGETPADTLRRLRMVQAMILLRDSRRSITEIAFDIGYSSSQAFSRAFRQTAGVPASGLRRAPERLEALIRDLSGPRGGSEAQAVVVRLVSVQPFKVIASRHVGPHKGLFRSFGELFRWAGESGEARDFRGIYGIPLDDPRSVPEDQCRFECCFDFGPQASSGPYRELWLGGGLYAVARHVGPYEGLDEMYDSLYGSWLDSSACSLRDGACFHHYLADPDTLPSDQWITDIYIPIVPIVERSSKKSQ